MGKMMYRMGRNDMTTTMEDMQLTPQVIQIESSASSVQVSVPELDRHFSRTGMSSTQIQYQMKSMKFANDQYQIYPGDYLELRCNAMYRQKVWSQDLSEEDRMSYRIGVTQ